MFEHGRKPIVPPHERVWHECSCTDFAIQRWLRGNTIDSTDTITLDLRGRKPWLYLHDASGQEKGKSSFCGKHMTIPKPEEPGAPEEMIKTLRVTFESAGYELSVKDQEDKQIYFTVKKII